MSEFTNPYATLAALDAAFARSRDDGERALRTRVPRLDAVRRAYTEDRIGVEQMERLIGAALTGTAVELPAFMLGNDPVVQIVREVWTEDMLDRMHGPKARV